MNPWFLAYSNLTGMLDVAKPGAIIVTGRGNRYDPAFQEARKRGAKVYTYWNVANAPRNLKNPEDAAQYLIGGKPPPAWPFKAKDGSDRTQWPGTYLLDLRPGSAWLKHIVPLTADVAGRDKFDGFFLDTLGARTWARTKTVNGVVVPGADWETWTVEEQTQWAACSVNIAKEIAAAVGPAIELVHNNIWTLPKGHPATDTAAQGDRHCNGVCLENPSGNVPSDFHKNYAGRIFGRLPRRVLVIDSTDADTLLWSKVPGVTHVASVEKALQETYARVTPPVVPYEPEVPPDPHLAEIAELRAQVASLTSERDQLRSRIADLSDELGKQDLRLDQIRELATKAPT